MGQQFNSGLTSVTGTVQSVDTTFTTLSASSAKNNAGTATLFTVPANHKYTLISAFAGAVGINTTAVQSSIAVNGVTVLLVQSAAGTNNTAIGSNDNKITLTKGTGFVATAGQTITSVQGGGSGLTYGGVIVVDEAV